MKAQEAKLMVTFVGIESVKSPVIISLEVAYLSHQHRSAPVTQGSEAIPRSAAGGRSPSVRSFPGGP